MVLCRIGLLLILICVTVCSFSQADSIRASINPATYKLIQRGYKSLYEKNDTQYVLLGLCNGYSLLIPKTEKKSTYLPYNSANKKKSDFLTVHGSVKYDFLYRSFLDSPFLQKDLQQHTLQTNLSILYKEKYPVHFNFITRLSNFPFYRNYFSTNLQFEKYSFDRKIKKDLLDAIIQQLTQAYALPALKEALSQETSRYQLLKSRLNSPDVIQQIVEAKERAYKRKLQSSLPDHRLPSVPGYSSDSSKLGIEGGLQKADRLEDSTTSSEEDYLKLVDDKKEELEQMGHHLLVLRSKIDSLNHSLNSALAGVKKSINQASDYKELNKIRAEYGIQENKKSPSAILSDFRTIGLGRTVVNYTELTAWNINVTGLNLEYNPSFYAAFAVGKMDYGYNTLFGRNTSGAGQHLTLGRLGWGKRDRAALIFTLFNGRKYNYASGLSDTAKSYVSLLGYSIEALIKENDHTFFSVEAAKSTYPITGNYNPSHQFNRLMNFSDPANTGINLKGQYYIPLTQTALSGFFRKTGAYYQSFSLFTYSTNQQAWQARIDQSFAKRKATLILMLRQNDFTNPYLQAQYKTRTVFKSVQINIQVPKGPTVSVGYYPGTQLYALGNNKVNEYVYYILNGSVIHSYALGNTRLISSFIYNRYFNQNTDSGFITYKGINYLFSQLVQVQKVQFRLGGAFNDQQELRYYTVEGGGSYQPFTKFSIGIESKYNRVLSGKVYWGGQSYIRADLKKVGSLQLQYEKSYLPTIYHSLYPIEIGGVSWYKFF